VREEKIFFSVSVSFKWTVLHEQVVKVGKCSVSEHGTRARAIFCLYHQSRGIPVVLTAGVSHKFAKIANAAEK
jgi:hypothetical protein